MSKIEVINIDKTEKDKRKYEFHCEDVTSFRELINFLNSVNPMLYDVFNILPAPRRSHNDLNVVLKGSRKNIRNFDRKLKNFMNPTD